VVLFAAAAMRFAYFILHLRFVRYTLRAGFCVCGIASVAKWSAVHCRSTTNPTEETCGRVETGLGSRVVINYRIGLQYNCCSKTPIYRAEVQIPKRFFRSHVASPSLRGFRKCELLTLADHLLLHSKNLKLYRLRCQKLHSISQCGLAFDTGHELS
jgi:hypothetical protein